MTLAYQKKTKKRRALQFGPKEKKEKKKGQRAKAYLRTPPCSSRHATWLQHSDQCIAFFIFLFFYHLIPVTSTCPFSSCPTFLLLTHALSLSLSPLLVPNKSNSRDSADDDEHVRPRRIRIHLIQRIHRAMELHREMESLFPELRPRRVRDHRRSRTQTSPPWVRIQPLRFYCSDGCDKVWCEGEGRY